MVTAGPVTWANWGRTAGCSPARTASPRGDDEIREVLARAAAESLPVKVVGAGHSFTDIACTEGVHVDLSRHNRVLTSDTAARTVTAEGGITLGALADELAKHGLAQSNLGDIGYQTLAGAISTATHGTGTAFGTLSTQVTALELLTAKGELVRCADGDLLRAARVSLGALGVISRVTLQCEPAFNLHAVEQPAKLDDVLERFEDLVRRNEHFEFYWFP
ncbi:MAG: FAD-binding protein, partial [Actinomycetota bacterium]